MQGMNPQMKKELRKYQQENGRVYGCWSCKVASGTLYKVGKNLYACTQHRRLALPW